MRASPDFSGEKSALGGGQVAIKIWETEANEAADISCNSRVRPGVLYFGEADSLLERRTLTREDVIKRLIINSVGTIALALAVNSSVGAETAKLGYVDFGTFKPPASGGEFVEVNIKGNLIAMVARLAEREEPEVAELLRGLRAIRVNVIELKEENRVEVEQRIKGIRAELEERDWERIVTARTDGDDVSVYLKTRGEEAVEGITVMVIDKGGEAVLVNVVGDIRPEQVAILGERFDIDPLKKVGAAIRNS